MIDIEHKPTNGGRRVEIWLVHNGRQWVAHCPDMSSLTVHSQHQDQAYELCRHQLATVCNTAASLKQRIPWTARTRKAPATAIVKKLRIMTHESGI